MLAMLYGSRIADWQTKAKERLMDKQPHILLITSDQHRADCLGYAGHPCVRTPHLDLLAREGCIFDRAYSDSPVCIPARTTMVTGIQAHHMGCCDYVPDFRFDRPREQFLGSLMTKAGYQTMLVGKQHWYTDPSFRGGFETWYSLKHLHRQITAETGGEIMYKHGIGRNELSPSLSQLPPDLNSSQWVTDRSIEFIKTRDKSQPLFLWSSMIEPHPPNVVHEPFYSMYDMSPIPEPLEAEWADPENAPYRVLQRQHGIGCAHVNDDELRKARGVYYGMITNIDHQIGRLIGTLQREGMLDDTLIIYTTDHGELLGDFNSFFKSNFFEGGARIPFIVRCPRWYKDQKGIRSDALIELADLLPTICEMGGAEIPDDIDGSSLCAVLRGDEEKVRDVMHGQIGTEHMYYDGHYKYIYFADDGRELIFDMLNDSQELCDLSSDKELSARLRSAFAQHLQEEGNEHINDKGELTNFGREFDGQDPRLGWLSLTP